MLIKQRLLVLSAPSGAGKTSIANKLLHERFPNKLVLSVSHTTREPRPGEMDGKEYYFVNKEEFEALRTGGGFAEWAQVHDNFYGTSTSEIHRLTSQGKDILFDIDWQGAIQLKTAYPEAILVFVAPPSMGELARRLRGRGTDREEVIRRRLKNAAGEMKQAIRFDYVVVNEHLEETVQLVETIYQAEGSRVFRNMELLRSLTAR